MSVFLYCNHSLHKWFLEGKSNILILGSSPSIQALFTQQGTQQRDHQPKQQTTRKVLSQGGSVKRIRRSQWKSVKCSNTEKKMIMLYEVLHNETSYDHHVTIMTHSNWWLIVEAVCLIIMKVFSTTWHCSVCTNLPISRVWLPASNFHCPQSTRESRWADSTESSPRPRPQWQHRSSTVHLTAAPS